MFATPLSPLSADSSDASANGKALEHACLVVLAEYLARRSAPTEAILSAAANTARRRFVELKPSTQNVYLHAARAGIELLVRVEPMLRADLTGAFTLGIQPDAAGAAGDVRDVVIRHANGWQIGVLVKHNNDAAKHPRLSGDLDFAAQWFNSPASRDYFRAVKPVFDELTAHAHIGAHWSSLGLREAEKAARFYRPVLAALLAELRSQTARHTHTAPTLLRYMTGRRDFYKLIATIKSRRVELHAYCFDGELGRATAAPSATPTTSVPRLRTPTRLLAADFKPGSSNTLLLEFDHSWALSLRLHSASSRVEPSLKLDARLTRTPAEMLKLTSTWSA